MNIVFKICDFSTSFSLFPKGKYIVDHVALIVAVLFFLWSRSSG